MYENMYGHMFVDHSLIGGGGKEEPLVIRGVVLSQHFKKKFVRIQRTKLSINLLGMQAVVYVLYKFSSSRRLSVAE
jgi:hypothetical protein